MVSLKSDLSLWQVVVALMIAIPALFWIGYGVIRTIRRQREFTRELDRNLNNWDE